MDISWIYNITPSQKQIDNRTHYYLDTKQINAFNPNLCKSYIKHVDGCTEVDCECETKYNVLKSRHIIPILLKAIKELKTELDNLKADYNTHITSFHS